MHQIARGLVIRKKTKGQVLIKGVDESPRVALLLQQPPHSCSFTVLACSENHRLQHVHLKIDKTNKFRCDSKSELTVSSISTLDKRGHWEYQTFSWQSVWKSSSSSNTADEECFKKDARNSGKRLAAAAGGKWLTKYKSCFKDQCNCSLCYGLFHSPDSPGSSSFRRAELQLAMSSV